MTGNKLVKAAQDILENHNGVYLEKQLYIKLKEKFPDIKRADFNEVLNVLMKEDYVLERGLIRPHLKMTKRTSYED